MLSLKKQCSSYKLEKILKKCKILLCYHFNNVNVAQWRLLKREVSAFTDLDFLLVKNKIAKKISPISLLEAENNQLPLNSATQIVADNCKLGGNNSTSKKNCNSLAGSLQKKAKGAGEKQSLAALESINQPDNCGLHATAPMMDQDEKKEIDSFFKLFQGPSLIIGCQKTESAAFVAQIMKNKGNLTFVGGVYEKKLITHLDFEVLTKLDNSAHCQLIHSLYQVIYTFLTVNQTQSNNLLYVLNQSSLKGSTGQHPVPRKGESGNESTP